MMFSTAFLFLPLPLLDTSKEHFPDVYEQLPSERDRPSLIPVASDEADKERKSVLVRGKVRAIIACGECSKPRCIYSPSTLSPKQSKEIEGIKDSKLIFILVVQLYYHLTQLMQTASL